MTSDGISDEDWDRVHDLALEVVNAADEEESDDHRVTLLAYLDQLEAKYGALPSVLATRADYIGEPLESQSLLERAYELARDLQDHRNMLHIASSLVSLQIEAFGDVDQAENWLHVFEGTLKDAGGESDIRQHEVLTKALATLRHKAGKI